MMGEKKRMHQSGGEKNAGKSSRKGERRRIRGAPLRFIELMNVLGGKENI